MCAYSPHGGHIRGLGSGASHYTQKINATAKPHLSLTLALAQLEEHVTVVGNPPRESQRASRGRWFESGKRDFAFCYS